MVWKFSRFTRKREHAVILKSMLRRKGLRVVSITEQAEDNPTGRLLEGIIESVDEFYSENLAMEVLRGMREAASRGFWVAPMAPYGYKKVKVLDGPKERPTLEPDPETNGIVKRIFDLAESRKGMMKIVRILNDEGIASPRGKLWNKPTVHNILRNEAHLGTLVWGNNAKDGADPVRVEKAFPAVVTKAQFDRVNGILRSRAPKVSHPRRVGSTFLLSGLVKCYRCKRALSGRYSSRGTFPYYVCHSFVKRAPGSCDSPRVDARQFEELVVGLIRSNILTEGNIRSLVNVVDEQMDDVAGDERKRLETIQSELADVRGRLDRLYDLVETTTEFNMADFAHRIRDHKERQERLESAAEGSRAILAQRRAVLDDVKTITAYAKDMSRFLQKSELTERRAFIETFVKEIELLPDNAVVRYTVPMPDDSLIPGKKVQEIPLNGSVVSSVNGSPPNWTKLRTLIWGANAKDKADPTRIERAFPAIISKAKSQRVNRLMRSRAPKITHPRRVGSSYLLSGLVKCKACRRAFSGQEAKSGQFSYYVCQSIMKRGKDACDSPRLNARRFEELVIGKIRSNVLTDGNIRALVKVVDEQMDGVAREQRKRLETIEDELEDVKRKLGRIWHFVETTDIDMSDASDRIKEHRERQERWRTRRPMPGPSSRGAGPSWTT